MKLVGRFLLDIMRNGVCMHSVSPNGGYLVEGFHIRNLSGCCRDSSGWSPSSVVRSERREQCAMIGRAGKLIVQYRVVMEVHLPVGV